MFVLFFFFFLQCTINEMNHYDLKHGSLSRVELVSELDRDLPVTGRTFSCILVGI